jgi:group II intron reverse transcriptase/maturase
MEMYTQQERIAYRARTHPQEAFVSVGHYLTREWLEEAYHLTRKDGAVGIDGVTAQAYEQNLDENLERLSDLARSGKYKAPPVRRVYVPKPGKKEVRPIGIPSFEDKVLQRGVAMILEAIYEQDFKDCSYGFRPGRSAHQALENIWQNVHQMGGCWILDVDIRKFFDTLDHQHLREILDRRIRDGVVRRLIGKWLKAGVWESGSVSYPDKGTPQGGCISPILSNIYLHTVLDEWFENQIKPRLKGRAFLVRFADDFVMGFSDERDALRVKEVLPRRFCRFGLEVHPDKTRLVNFMPPHKHPEGNPGTFDFLGFNHGWGKSKWGNDTVKRKTAKDRLSRALKTIKQYCGCNRHLEIAEQCKALNRKLIGHYAYFGITGNYRYLNRVYHETKRIWFKWLRRRTRGGKGMTWDRFTVLTSTVFTLKRPKIMHSYT